MVVEDEFFVALDIQDIVEGMGHLMDGPYPTVREASDALCSQKPTCAILDVRLKDGDVFPLADALDAAAVPIIFHSGHADDAHLRRRYPLALICSKPSSPSALQSAIEDAIRNDAGGATPPTSGEAT